jgi:hypothetical protein
MVFKEKSSTLVDTSGRKSLLGEFSKRSPVNASRVFRVRGLKARTVLIPNRRTLRVSTLF